VLEATRAVVGRALAIADTPADDDDLRLRKRVGVASGFITVLAPWTLPFSQPGIGLWLAIALSLYAAANLAILRVTKRFERYVVALIAVGVVFVFTTNAVAGGVTSSGAAWVWAFLVPIYAILALGPRRATPWLFVFLAGVITAVALDPIIRTWFPAPPYSIQLAYYAQNLIVPLTITFLLFRYTDLLRRAAEARSDELLTNAIPRSIATRLRHGESRIADSYPETSVVFCDIEQFTPFAARTDPARLVDLLDDLFSKLDEAAAVYGVEKIKTVGDAYMAVAGAPVGQRDHAERAVQFSRAALEAMSDWRTENGVDLQLRIGIGSGPVVGGVIGRQRMLFDLWGSTVNTAQRMEASGVPGRIHVSQSTRDRLPDDVSAEERSVDVKGLGPMTTYLLEP
jgi:guanylate cyclase